MRPAYTVRARVPALGSGPSPRKEVIIFSSAAPSCAEPIPSLDTTIHPHHPADVPATLPLLSPCLLVHLHRVRRHCLLRYWRRCTNLKESVLRYRLMDSHPTITPASAFSIPGKTHIVHLCVSGVRGWVIDPRFPSCGTGATRRIRVVGKILYSIHLLCESGRPDDTHGGYSSVGRAADCGSAGRAFEPRYPPQQGPASAGPLS